MNNPNQASAQVGVGSHLSEPRRGDAVAGRCTPESAIVGRIGEFGKFREIGERRALPARLIYKPGGLTYEASDSSEVASGKPRLLKAHTTAQRAECGVSRGYKKRASEMRLSLPHSRFSETPLYQVVLSSPYSTLCVIVWGFQPRAHLRRAPRIGRMSPSRSCSCGADSWQT